MKHYAFRGALLTCVALSLVVLFGCGGGGAAGGMVEITGTLTKSGKPLVINDEEGGRVDIHFIPIDESGKVIKPSKVAFKDKSGEDIAYEDIYFTNADFDGTYSIRLPAGKYKIAVAHIEKEVDDAENEVDLLSWRFDAERTTIGRIITSSGRVDIDLDNPEG